MLSKVVPEANVPSITSDWPFVLKKAFFMKSLSRENFLHSIKIFKKIHYFLYTSYNVSEEKYISKTTTPQGC